MAHCYDAARDGQVEERLLDAQPDLSRISSPAKPPRLAEACRECPSAFLRGGRLLAFGRGPYATDAQHVSVEFVHPVIVGKRALPALDLSMLFRPWLEAILHPEDIVMGFGPPEGDDEIRAALEFAHARKAHDLRSCRAWKVPMPSKPSRRSVHASGDDRDSLSHAVGDGARLLRASRTRPRCRRRRISLSVSGPGKTADRRSDLRSRSFDP